MQLIGEFYREKVLARPDLVTRELLGYGGEQPEIVEDLFGWQVRAGREVFDCRSEAEARYLRVFLALGLREVCVPADDEYLNRIVPDLEYLKRRADEILDEHLATVFDLRVKAKVRRDVYAEITQWSPSD